MAESERRVRRTNRCSQNFVDPRLRRNNKKGPVSYYFKVLGSPPKLRSSPPLMPNPPARPRPRPQRADRVPQCNIRSVITVHVERPLAGAPTKVHRPRFTPPARHTITARCTQTYSACGLGGSSRTTRWTGTSIGPTANGSQRTLTTHD